MSVVDIDVVGAEPPQALVDLVGDVFPVEAGFIGTLGDAPPDLRGEDRLVPPALQRLAELLLRDAAVVRVRGVEEVDARVQRSPHDVDRVAFADVLAVEDRAKAQRRYLQAGPAHVSVLHVALRSGSGDGLRTAGRRRLPGSSLHVAGRMATMRTEARPR